MQDAGVAVIESFDTEIYENSFKNVKYGIRISLGGSNSYVHDNVFDTCSSCKLHPERRKTENVRRSVFFTPTTQLFILHSLRGTGK